MSKLQPRQARSVARLAAVQALYQMEAARTGVDGVIREFRDHRFEADIEGEQLASADEDFFEDVVRGVVTGQGEIDQAIARRLASGWKLERLDSTVRAALRCGAYELMKRPDVPIEVAIDEYIDIAKAFTDEAGFLNAALDAIARDVRPTPGGG
jgi:N utilization substance protein B